DLQALLCKHLPQPPPWIRPARFLVKSWIKRGIVGRKVGLRSAGISHRIIGHITGGYSIGLRIKSCRVRTISKVVHTPAQKKYSSSSISTAQHFAKRAAAPAPDSTTTTNPNQ